MGEPGTSHSRQDQNHLDRREPTAYNFPCTQQKPNSQPTVLEPAHPGCLTHAQVHPGAGRQLGDNGRSSRLSQKPWLALGSLPDHRTLGRLVDFTSTIFDKGLGSSTHAARWCWN